MTAPTIQIAPELSLPLDVVTKALAIVAQRGAGKTYLTRVLAEELIGKGLPLVILDPLGVYYGLGSGPDGRKEGGLPVTILGGAHGDIPLLPENGRAVASYLVRSPRHVIIDLSEFRKSGQREFVTGFAEELYHENRDPLHLIVDEADLYIPQRPQRGEERMLGAFEDVVRRGRARGLGISMITQRPAVLNKDVLTQADALVMLRLAAPQDRKAVEAWINVQGEPEKMAKVLNSLPSLPIGTAWFWSPGWLGLLRKIHVRTANTFDSSRTPKVGEITTSPERMRPADIEELRSLLSPQASSPKPSPKPPKGLRKMPAVLEKSAPKGMARPKKTEKVIHSTRDFPEGVEVELRKLGARVEELSRTVERLTRTAADMNAAPFTPSILDDVPESAQNLKPQASSPEGFSQMEEELYQKFKMRMISELRGSPELLELVVKAPAIRVTREVYDLEADGSSIRGTLAVLITEGFFAKPTNGNRAFKELQRRGVKCAGIAVYRECEELTTLGFLTSEKDGFREAPGVRERILIRPERRAAGT